MNIDIEKSYGLLRFINKKRSKPVRAVYGFFCFVVLIFLGSPYLVARDSFFLALQPGCIKVVVRRLVWFLHAGWFPISIRSDYFFDISEEMSDDACFSLVGWLESNARIDSFDRYIWKADLYGGVIERRCEAEGELVIKKGGELKHEDELFCCCVDMALSALSEKLSSPPVSSKKTKKFKKSGASFDKKDAYKAISDFRELMEELGWSWYVVSGTFLGAVREEDFLGHDYDIDVGVDYSEFDLESLAEAVGASGEKWFIKSYSYCTFREPNSDGSVRYYQMDKPILVKLVHATGLVADLFVHVEEDGVLWHGSPIHRWDNTLFDLSEYKLGAEVVYGAADADRYLTENYGDWRTPVIHFDCSIDPPNIRYSRTARSVTYLTKVANRFLIDGDVGSANRYLASLEESGVLVRDGMSWRYKG